MKRSAFITGWLVIMTFWHSHNSLSVANAQKSEWVCIATVGGLDRITQTHISSLLGNHGIRSMMEGSLAYGISVPPKDQARAIELLKSDLKTRRYRIILHENGQGVQHPGPDILEERAPKKKLADLLTLVEYDRSTDLGSVLRSAQVANAGLAFPYVSVIKFMRREYLDGTNRLNHGHEVEIELVASLRQRIGGVRYRFQVWDGGKQLQWMGGNEWWQGNETAARANQRKYDKRPKTDSGATPPH